MAYKIHVGEDDGKTQALFDKLVDGYYLRNITVTSDGYMEIDARTMHGGMSEKELERLCVKYFHATGKDRLKLQIDEYSVSFHCKKWIKVTW